MAGILDNKKRIMDTIVTQEGRRQLSSGNFKIKYASFTDGNVFYEGDNETGTTDATLRVPFEAVNKFQDSIIFETDDSGNLISFKGKGIDLTPDGSIAIEDSELDDPLSIRRLVTSTSLFASEINNISEESFNSFRDQNFITTKSEKEAPPFSINQSSDSFAFTIGSGYDNEVVKEKAVNSLPSFVNDSKLANVLNFKYLPPINNNDSSPNGNYTDLNTKHTLSASDVEALIDRKQTISSSLSGVTENNVMFQVFENNIDKTKITKLDMLDAGSFVIKGESKRIIFVGKVMIDKFEQPTFVNIFTVEVTK